MTTPDQIALPELPKSLDSVRVMGRWEQDDAAPCDDYYTADQMRAYGQACVEALTREAPKEGLEDEWKPIDSAPKDGSYILVANSHGAWVAKWHPVYQSGYRPSNPWASMMLNHDHIAKPGRFDHPAHWRELKAPAMTPDMARVDVGRGDYQDKALAWDAVCVALNTYCPGWANNSAKTGLQSAVDAIEALTPAPQVPEGMVLVPREPTPEMVDAGWEAWRDCDGENATEKLWAAMLAAAPSTPPLNELLGQREEFNLNEVSGNPGQLASLEQRAREDELPSGFVWLTASAAHRSDAAANIRQLAEDVGAYDEPAGIVPAPTQARLLADIGDALEADALFHRTAALSAQPREVQGVDANALGVDVAALRQIAGELRDNAHHHRQEDREVGIFADEQEAQFNTELAERIERALTGDTTTPQDAAGVEEMSPDFTDSARAAIAWVLYHHQGGSSPVGQPLRFALGMGADDPLPNWRIAEAKRYAEWAGASTECLHTTPPDGAKGER